MRQNLGPAATPSPEPGRTAALLLFAAAVAAGYSATDVVLLSLAVVSVTATQRWIEQGDRVTRPTRGRS